MSKFSSPVPVISRDINDRLDAIVAKWLVRLKKEVSAVHDLSDEFLVDHMPVFLKSLATSFVNPEDTLVFKSARENAKAHGSQRARSKYTVPQLINDYIYLREVILAEISLEPSKFEMLALSRYFEAAIGAAVEEFTATRQRKNADQNLRSIADAVLTLIIRVDTDFRYTFVNRAYEVWTGRSEVDVIGRSVSEVISKEDYPAILEMMSRALAGERISFEHKAPRADGQHEHMLFTCVPSTDSQGRANGVVITGQSIEQQKRAEFDAQERRHELANAFAQAPTPIALMMGPDLVYTLANKPYTDLVERNPLGRKLRSVFDAKEAGHLIDLVERVYKTGEPYYGKELAFSPGGHPRTINVAYFPYRSTSGEINGVLSFATDVTDQVRAREAIRDSEMQLRAVFAHASVGFAVSDLKGKFVEVNPRFGEITGYTSDELKQLHVVDLIYKDDLEKDRLKLDDLTGGRVANFVIEKRFVKKDGSLAWVRNSVSLVPSPGHEPLVIRVAEDVTAIREAESQYRTLADSMPQIVWTATPDGLIDKFNKVWYEYSGADPAKTPTEQWNDAAYPADLQNAIDGWAVSLQTGQNFESKVRLRSRTGEYRWFMARGRAGYDESGRINL